MNPILNVAGFIFFVRMLLGNVRVIDNIERKFKEGG